MSLAYQHTMKIKVGYKAEVNGSAVKTYATGKGTTKYDQTPLAASDGALLTAMSALVGGGQFGSIEFDRPPTRIAGDGPDSVRRWTSGIRYKEFVLKTVIQSTVWLDASIEADEDEIPQSYMFHVEKNGVAVDILGCVVKKYEVDLSGKFPMETITFSYYSVIASAIITSGGTFATAPFLVTQPKIKKDFSATWNGTAINNFKSMKLSITNSHVDDEFEGVAGKYFRDDPYLQSREIECNFEGTVDNNALTNHPATEAIDDDDLVIAGWGKSLTIVDAYVDNSNKGEYSEFGTILYKFTLMNSTGAISTA